MSETRACCGADTMPCRLSDLSHAQQCRKCGTRVRDDLVEHPFFGFVAGCHQPARGRASEPSPN